MGSLILIRCDCGTPLGKVAGKYEFYCRKCGKFISGDTRKMPESCDKEPLWRPKNFTVR
ncbi:MAG TPA: hypothetical protein VN604_07735 [Nitrospirota bacterium]|nr:hypothetical protein [Nitrospirota bacterium]